MIRYSAPLGLDLVLLVIAASLLYFPGRFPAWSVPVALLLLALGWLLRWKTLGAAWRRTPGDLALILFMLMVPVAVWAAPGPLREQYAWPRTYILIWNLALFSAIVTHGSLAPARRFGLVLAGFIAAAMLISLAAPFGINWLNKFRWLTPLLERIPGVFVGVFAGAEAGFSGNQTAGALLFVIPLLLALTVAGLRHGHRHTLSWWLIAICALWMSGVLLLTQSRGGMLGLAAGMGAMLVLLHRKGWWLLLGATLLAILLLPLLPATAFELLNDAPAEAVGGMGSLTAFRPTVWNAGLSGIQDFPFTGMGFGTFRQVAHLLYPLPGIAPDFDIAHAHNFFLQTALDFGLPGLVAVLAIYGVAVTQVVQLWGKPGSPGTPLPSFVTWRVLAIGFAGILVGQTVYSQFDVVAMGSKPNFLWWYLLALIFAAGNLTSRSVAEVSPEGEGAPLP